MGSGPRDPYAAVGEATREVIERACRERLPGRRYRVLLAVIHATSAWSKLADEVSHAEIARVAGIDDPREVRNELRALHEAGIIRYTPGASPKGGQRVRSSVTLAPDRGAEGPGGELDRGSGETGGPEGARPPGHMTARPPGHMTPPIEKSEVSEGRSSNGHRPRNWSTAWTDVASYVRRWGAQDPERPEPGDQFDPRTLAAVHAIGGFGRVRRTDEATRFAFRDAWQEAGQ